MSITTAQFNLDSMQRATCELSEKIRHCDNGEGLKCINLEATITCHLQVCNDLMHIVQSWSNEVFSGRTEFSDDIEAVLKAEVQEVLQHARMVATRGIEFRGVCYEFEDLNLLCQHVLLLQAQLENWTSPRRSVSPAPRIELSEQTAHEINTRLLELSPRSNVTNYLI
jgi:hypothetical protein